MKISIFGLGYVGAVSAACFAANGHEVVGVDRVDAKVDLINAGRAPIIERDLDRLIAQAVGNGSLRATADARDAVLSTDLSMICVGTPSRSNGNLDLAQVEAVSSEIGTALNEKNAGHIVVVRSTVLPGSTRDIVVPALQSSSGREIGRDFTVGINPEFLREGTAVQDFYQPPKTVVGVSDRATGESIASLYDGIEAPLILTSTEAAEMVKYTDNAWHALKVAFANEIGAICKVEAIDSHEVMRIFCQDKKLNLSSAYLTPGFSFGGSCLPKDVRALTYKGRALDLDLPVLNAILPSNERQTSRGFEMIASRGRRPVSFLGLSFKAGTDDMRESPLVELIERLLGKGFDIRIFDRNVNLSRLIGANRDYLLRMIPHVSALLVDTLDEALLHGETIVIGNGDPEFGTIASRLRPSQFVVDLVHIAEREKLAGRYNGVN